MDRAAKTKEEKKKDLELIKYLLIVEKSYGKLSYNDRELLNSRRKELILSPSNN